MAVIWLVGLRWRVAPARWYAGTLIAAMVLARMLYHTDEYEIPFQLIINDRFVSLAFVAIALFLVSWGYRRFGIAGERLEPTNKTGTGPQSSSLEVLALQPFANMRMAELATYSIVWAIYAATVVVMGFVLRSRFYRILGLVAFAPILAKVFLVDLAQLDEFARVLATFALGFSLLAVSFLYQKFAAKALR